VADPPKRDVQGFATVGAEGPESYAFLRVTRAEGLRQELHITDLGASTPRGARQLLRFLADHDSLADRILWFGNPADAALGQVPEFVWKTRLFFPWMLRILDPRAALEARGYPLGLSAELHFEIQDATLPENDGRFVLEIAEGAGRVRPGGQGHLRADIRGLAAIYGGWSTPQAARGLGLLDGAEEMLQRAAAAFAGPIPWMTDMF
jgi:predicted acetyltransferase